MAHAASEFTINYTATWTVRLSPVEQKSILYNQALSV